MDPIAQSTTVTVSGGGLGILLFIYLALFVVFIASFWIIFTKAGEAGWKSLIPIYNLIILLKIVGREWWWILLMLIPIVSLVILIIVYNDLSKSFGKGTGFTVGLILLSFVFFPILAFGPARYLGPAGKGGGGTMAPPAPPMPPAPA